LDAGQARQADKVFKKKYGMRWQILRRYQVSTDHLEMFPMASSMPNAWRRDRSPAQRRVTIGMFPWRFVDGESLSHAVCDPRRRRIRVVDGQEKGYAQDEIGDAYDPQHVERITSSAKPTWNRNFNILVYPHAGGGWT